MKYTLCIALLATISLSACATVIRGNNEVVSFTSSPQGADVSTSTGVRCTTPCDAKVRRKHDFDAKFILNGESKTVNVDSKITVPVAAAAVVGNAVVGGIIGIGVDIGTGALKSHAPNPVHVDFDGRSTGQASTTYAAPATASASLCGKDSPPMVGGTSYC